MDDAHASGAAALPLTAGGARLAALELGPLFSVAPFRGRRAEAATALGAPLPAGRTVASPAGRLIWAGHGLWLLRGPDPRPRLEGVAAVTDQSDAWVGLALVGPAARDVLARLVPLDLDPAAFPPETAARSLLGHLPVLVVLALAPDGFELHVARSSAGTAVRDLATAMRSVAARGRLG